MPFLVFLTNHEHMIVGYSCDVFLPACITIFRVVFFSFTVRIQWQATTGKTEGVQSEQVASHARTNISHESSTATHPNFLYTAFNNSVYIQTQGVYYHPNLIFFYIAIISVSRLFGRHSVIRQTPFPSL